MLIASVAVMYLTYEVSIKKTISQFRKNQELISLAGSSDLLIADLSQARAQFSRLDSMRQMSDALEDYGAYLLGVVNKQVNKSRLQLVTFQETKAENKPDFYLIIVEGTYQNCLLVLSELEKKSINGKITKMDFEATVSSTDKSRSLSLSIWIENNQ
jgi:hypothetical protein